MCEMQKNGVICLKLFVWYFLDGFFDFTLLPLIKLFLTKIKILWKQLFYLSPIWMRLRLH